MPRPCKLKVAPPNQDEDLTPSQTPKDSPRLSALGSDAENANARASENAKARSSDGGPSRTLSAQSAESACVGDVGNYLGDLENVPSCTGSANGNAAALRGLGKLEEEKDEDLQDLQGCHQSASDVCLGDPAPPRSDSQVGVSVGVGKLDTGTGGKVSTTGSTESRVYDASGSISTEQMQEVDIFREDMKCVATLLIEAALFSAGLIVLFVEKDKFDAGRPPCRTASKEPPRKCEPCGDSTWVIPLGGEMEQSWPRGLRAVLYFFGLGWCFLGVAIVCDQFMAAIEEVTSKTRAVWVEGAGHSRHKVHLRLWNDTISNLTLMALGSSAPEILLNLLELIGNDFFSGQLGPSTIVGSAAFNLLVITAVCITALPGARVLKVVRTEVFAITAVFSILAYFWLIVTLAFITPDKVDLWEAIVTFAFFPVLLIMAFLADKGYFRRFRCSRATSAAHVSENQITQAQREMKEKFGKAVSFDNVKTLLEATSPSRSRTGSLMGKTRSSRTKTRLEHRRTIMRSFTGNRSSSREIRDGIAFGFAERRYVVLECAGEVNLTVVASKPVPDCVVTLHYVTSDIDAMAGERYEAVEGWIRFENGELEKNISIPIIDNDTWEPTQSFICELTDIKVIQDDSWNIKASSSMKVSGRFGNYAGRFHIKNPMTKVAILNDDEPGTLSFRSDEVTPIKNAPSITLVIDRRDGVCGDIKCHYESRDGSAVQGFDYDQVEGDLHFVAGQDQQVLKVPILQTAPHPDDRSFYVILNDPTEGVLFDAETSGGAKSAICEVILAGEPTAFHSFLRYFTKFFNKHKFQFVALQWRDQFKTALYVGGSRSEQVTADLFGWIFHVLSLFWKLLFAIIPPPACMGGWPCFVFALLMIGVVTAVVSDLAGLLGCCVGMPEDICAITLVALGTSLPDTFASRSAAMTDDTADNSVGNVTGSNSVNVFLGMGIPWTLGAIYWRIKGRNKDWQDHYYKKKTFQFRYGGKYPNGGLIVPAESLALSVVVFTVTAVLCLALLLWRRMKYGGELGGPRFANYRDSALLIWLWCLYIIASVVISLLND